MNLVRLGDDEILITDGKIVLLIMSRDGNIPPQSRLEVEGSSLDFFMESACSGCKGFHYAKRQGLLCECCTVGDDIPQ